MNFILASIGVFLVTILVLVVILLVAKNFLVASGNVKLTINGDKDMEVESGSTLLNTLAVNGVFLPSACGGKGSCGQCKCQVVEGGGEILPSEVSHFSRKQQKDHWRLGCQVKVKGDMANFPSLLSIPNWLFPNIYLSVAISSELIYPFKVRLVILEILSPNIFDNEPALSTSMNVES